MPRRKDDPRQLLSAMFGQRVQVQKRGKDWIFTALKPRRRKKSSPAQITGQSKFSRAVDYARDLLRDPKKKKAYERNLKGHRNAFQRAMSEYMKSH